MIYFPVNLCYNVTSFLTGVDRHRKDRDQGNRASLTNTRPTGGHEGWEKRVGRDGMKALQGSPKALFCLDK